MGAMAPGGIMARLLYGWEKLMYESAEKIIVLLTGAKDYVKDRGISTDKVVWMSNGVNLELFDRGEPLDPESGVAKAFAKHAQKFKILYTGAHGPANGLDKILGVAALLQKAEPSVHFFFVGDGPEKRRLVAEAAKLGLDNVSFLSPVPETQMPILLRMADVLLFCLRKVDVFGYGISSNKLWDYLAGGKPVVMAGRVSNDVFSKAGAGITVDPDDVEKFAEAILKIKSMVPQEREMAGCERKALCRT